MYQHFTEVQEGKVKTLLDCSRVVSRIYPHMEEELLGKEYQVAMTFLVQACTAMTEIVKGMNKPCTDDLLRSIPAPADIVDKLKYAEWFASKSYNTFCRQQESRLGWLPTPKPRFA